MHTRDELMAEFDYDKETGLFWFTRRASGRQIARPVGSLTEQGYIVIQWEGVHYSAHRLAWLFVTGEWPRYEIDHKDRKPWHNSFANLRDVNRSLNALNIKGHSDKTSDLPRGIDLKDGSYRVRLQVNGKRREMSGFLSLEAALAVWKNWIEFELGMADIPPT